VVITAVVGTGMVVVATGVVVVAAGADKDDVVPSTDKGPQAVIDNAATAAATRIPIDLDDMRSLTQSTHTTIVSHHMLGVQLNSHA